MTLLAFDMVSACASVLATMKSTPCSPDAIMLFTALPPAPPTPSTTMRALISRISVVLVILASLLLCQPANERMGLLPVTSLAVCINEGRSEMSDPALSAAVDRAAGSANAPQSRHLAFKPCGRLLGCHGR